MSSLQVTELEFIFGIIDLELSQFNRLMPIRLEFMVLIGREGNQML